MLVLNKDNEYSKEFVQEAKSTVKWFSGHDSKETLLVPGEHNKANATAAKVVGQLVGVSDEEITRVLSKFTGLPHRIEKVAMVDDVTFVNDSASTTPIAAITAINAFPHKNIILITGGNTKNLPMEDFIEKIKSRVKTVIMYEGTAANDFKSLQNIHGPYKLGEFDEVVLSAKKYANPGDIVLFSPGLTHLPVINEFERGDRYKAAVARLQKKVSSR